MAEIVSSNNPTTTIVLNSKESWALGMVLSDWVDDSYTRGFECGEPVVIETYKEARDTLTELFAAFGPFPWPED